MQQRGPNNMLNFKNRDEALPSGLIVVSLLILLGSLLYMLIVPKPTTAGLVTGRERSRKQLEDEIVKAKTRDLEARKAFAPRLWAGNTETITASVLAELTTKANKGKLQMGAFRPQKQQMLEGLTELPFSLQVAGPFPAVRAFIATLDVPNSRLALRSVQFASSDAATSAVTATLGISAYMLSIPPPSEKEDSAKPTTGGNRG